ncbi:MAG: NupC/NupG family nucleoside CNT transporter [Nitrospinales bacterium]
MPMLDENVFRMVAFFGFCLIPFLAWVTGNRGRVNRNTILGSIALIWVFGLLTFWLPWSRQALEWINNIMVAVLNASFKGTVFLFGPLAMGPGQKLPDGTPSVGFILAVQILPIVIFFSAVVAGLYYLNIMQAIVKFFARIFYKAMGLSGAEALVASANIFVGIESSIAVRPYLQSMTRSELLTLLTCMMATVASTVMGIYVFALKDVFPQIAGHLVSASIISIPCAVLISKLSLPEIETPETASANFATLNEDEPPAKNENLFTAMIDGGVQGMRMAVGIAIVLIVVLGLEAIIDQVLNLLPLISGEPISIARILGWVVWPFVVILGLRPEEYELAAKILGARFIEGEVPAYFTLAAAQASDPMVFSQRSLTSMTYALCGFVHVSSIGIFVGGITALIPERAKDLSILGIRALWTSFLATLLTGCLAGILS